MTYLSNVPADQGSGKPIDDAVYKLLPEFLLRRRATGSVILGSAVVALAWLRSMPSSSSAWELIGAFWPLTLSVLIVLFCCAFVRWLSLKRLRSTRRALATVSMIAVIEGSCLALQLSGGSLESVQVNPFAWLIAAACVIAMVVTLSGHVMAIFCFCAPLLAYLIWGLMLVNGSRDTGLEPYKLLPLGIALGFAILSLGLLIIDYSRTIREAITAAQRNAAVKANLRAAVHSARRANQAKTRFLAAASHDLRQPINSLALLIASLGLRTESSEQQNIVDSMSLAIKSIDSQLESLLDISKLDAGIIEPSMTVLDLCELCAQLVDTYQRRPQVDVRMSFSRPEHPVWIKTDPALAARILSNLLGNAFKYTVIGAVNLGIRVERETATVTIEDSGVGIAEEDLHKVFDEFYQVGNPQREASRGLGLGLSIVQRLSLLLGFKLSLRSKLGVGTAISVLMPLSASPRRVEQQQRVARQPRTQQHVLVLDNEVEITQAMQTLISRLGHRVNVYHSGDAALLGLTQHPFDIALIDYRLPGQMNGVDIIQRLRRMDRRIECYLVTGDSDIQQDLTGIPVIYKPLTQDKLQPVFERRVDV